MKLKDPELAEHDQRISISDRWVEDLQGLYTDAIAVLLQHHADPSDKAKGFTLIQRIDLTRRTKPGTPPKEDFDEVVDVIARSAWAYLAQRLEAEEIEAHEAVGFSIQVVQSNGRATTRRRVYFTVSFDGNADDPYDDPNVQALSELERRQLQLIDSLQSVVETQRTHISEMQERFLSVATTNAKPMSEIARMMEMSGNMMGSGMSALLGGLKMQFDHTKAEAAERESTRRTQAVMDGLREQVGPLLPMVMGIVAQKMGLGGTMPTPDFGAQDGTSGEDEQTEDPNAQIDEQYRQTLTSFRDSLTTEQWQAVRDSMRGDEFSTFEAVLNSQSAMETFENMERFVNSVEDLSFLAELQQALSDQQMATVMQLWAAFAKYDEQKKAAASEGGGTGVAS